MIDPKSIRIVLQGEYALASNDEGSLKLQTPIARTCIVLILKSGKFCALAHIDDYTSVSSVFTRISLALKKRYDYSFTQIRFEAQLFGGTEAVFSKQQKELILKCLKTYQITIVEPKEVPKEPFQTGISVKNQEVYFVQGEKIDPRFEYLQGREYGSFKTLLDHQYRCMKGTEIPYFETREATRLLSDIPYFQMVGETREKRIKDAQDKEGREFLLPLKIHREVFIDESKTADCLSIAQEKAIQEMKALVRKDFGDVQIFSTLIEEKNFELLLRKTATNGKYFTLLSFLVKHASLLNINISAKGKTSGTALEIAKKAKNQEGTALLRLRSFFNNATQHS